MTMQSTKAIGCGRRARSWSRFHGALFPDVTMPGQRWEVDVAGYLFEKGYHIESTRLVLAHAREHGSVTCCPELAFSERDRDAVEARLPECPAAEWARYGDDVWSILGELPA
jgi:hypothetical protein